MSSVVQNLKLDQIRTNGGTQPRTSLNESTVAEYAEAITEGAKLPPVTVFHDGADYWLADGFHRFFAHMKIGALDIAADVCVGSKRDAILHSVGANAAHGLRRTNDDKRKAALTLLEDAEWMKWSDNKIAQACGVSQPFVSGIRQSLQTVISDGPAERTYTTKHGTEAVMKTDKIGKKKAGPAVPLANQPANEPAATPEPERDGPDDAELAAMEAAEAADREIMAKLLDSDDALATAHAEITRLNAVVAGLQQRVNGLLNEKAEAIKLAKREANRSARLQKELDQYKKVAA